jgi:hypothetical protein
MITNGARCTGKIKSSIATAKAAFNKKNFFTSKWDLNSRKEPLQCYIWSTALCGVETWAVGKHIRNSRQFMKCGAGEGRRRPVGPIV